MRTQNIKASTANIIGSFSQSVNSKGKQQGSNFEQIMTSSMSQKWDASNGGVYTIDYESGKDGKYASYRNESSNAKKVDKYTKASSNKTVDTAIHNKRNDSESVSETTNEIAEEKAKESTKKLADKKNSELLKRIMELLNSIQQAALGILNRTPEELQELLEEQGMTIADLQNQDMLRQLVLADSGQSDVSALLMDENLANTMRKLLLEAEELSAKSGLDFTDEQVKNILAQLDNGLVDQLSNSIATVQGEFYQEDRITPEWYIRQDVVGHSIDDETREKVPMDEMDLNANNLEASKESNAARVDTDETMGSLSNEDNSEIQYHSDNRQQEVKSVDDFSGFVNQMVEVTQRTQMDGAGNTVQVTELREIANQIIEQIKVVVSQDHTSMELQLNPENLGKVNLSIQSKDGMMTAQFVVENELTKEAIESQMFTLKNTLEQQGIKVENIEVTVANYSFEQSGQADTQKDHGQQGNTTSRKLTLEEAMQMNDLPQEDIDKVDITGIRGSQIDYTA